MEGLEENKQVGDDTSLIEVYNLMQEKNLPSLVVVDKNGNNLGTIENKNFIVKESLVYLPTFINFFNQLSFYKKDSGLLKYRLERILSVKAKDIVGSNREIDKEVNTFLNDIKYKFIIVSKARTRIWIVVSILFGLIGYAIAWILILKVN